MAERIADKQLCPHCNSPHTRYAGRLGSRQVWRCWECSRTFWARKRDSWIIRGLKSLLNASQPGA